ncbi:GPO family capsid scaffolding protein [Morganella morganii]|uniref:GPO family capsid scaffolding protein n=1 Tax=Morganella morganii TaxID=582 RepID=UPI000BBD2ADD|nr:GPO family capsid scaffolding protein [Morganella morganii]ATF53053.1 GPO family capsid scaffolding protein [Morganella morganii]EKL3977749.1 GPO family capsid scaffolding protein [Morganella morganii]EKU6424851.1 GPO family capsid scaffolding protein [Morganella morganii]ELA9134096.1 GPO family capsid scaffolding protein [Morganella morganii]ELB1013835.1 GPO family capsid scaffolding protein [Morganella morganii]
MTVKTKPVRICVEGATTDGRTVQRSWLTDIEKNYDPNVYGARINLEHLGYEWMPRFGDVESVHTAEITEGALKGKLALYATLLPTDELIQMNKKRQKVYTSAEIAPKFSDTGEAYLVGLAVTDSPASLGTEMLQFSQKSGNSPLSDRKQSKDNVFTLAEETVIELAEDKPEEPKGPSLFSRITEMLTGKGKQDDARFHDVHQSVELCAKAIEAIQTDIAGLKKNALSLSQPGEPAGLDLLKKELSELKDQLSKQDGSGSQRPVSFGNNGTQQEELLTDC